MKLRVVGAAAFALGLALGGQALPADMAKLEWGAFTVLSDSSNQADSWTASASTDGMTLTFAPKRVVAKADGSTLEARANISGQFDVFQPKNAAIAVMRVKINGYLIKNAGSLAKAVINLGGESHTVEWSAADANSGNFTKEFDLPVKSGQLPNPFTVSAEAFASKNGTESGVLLSIDSIEVTLDTDSTKMAATNP
jgi:hypothetical protein